MRLGKVLLCLLAVAFLLLLLSALVVYTPDETLPAQPAPAPMRVTLMPRALPAADGASAAAQPAPIARALFILVTILVACSPLKAALRDANGRVIRARRYENSFYPVFRPEVAGG